MSQRKKLRKQNKISKRSQTLYKGKLLHLTGEEFRFSSGKRMLRETIRHPGSCAIIPVLPGQKVILIRQYRSSVKKTLWEIPAGTLEKGENPRTCAARELIEETGYKSQHLMKLGTFYTSPGFCTEKMHLFLATALTHVSQHLEEDETIKPRLFRLETAKKMVQRGSIQDAKTIIGLSFLPNPFKIKR